MEEAVAYLLFLVAYFPWQIHAEKNFLICTKSLSSEVNHSLRFFSMSFYFNRKDMQYSANNQIVGVQSLYRTRPVLRQCWRSPLVERNFSFDSTESLVRSKPKVEPSLFFKRGLV